MISFILIDDEVQFLASLSEQIHQMHFEFPYEIRTYNDEQHLLLELSTLPKQSIFLIDLVLKQTSGVTLANAIHLQNSGYPIIFITSFLDELTEIVESEYCYFIYKPELEYRLSKAITKGLEFLHNQQQEIHLILKNKVTSVPLSSIAYIESEHRKCILYCEDRQYEEYARIDTFIDRLPDTFVQCHKSYIVNMNKIKEFTRTQFIMKDDTNIPISRVYATRAKDCFYQYLLRRF